MMDKPYLAVEWFDLNTLIGIGYFDKKLGNHAINIPVGSPPHIFVKALRELADWIEKKDNA